MVRRKVVPAVPAPPPVVSRPARGTTSWGEASAILAEAGVEDSPSYYRQFSRKREKAALTVCMRIQAAWAANDADMFAEVFAENGSLLMRDDQLTSREEIRSYMANVFAGAHRGARVKGWPIEVRFLNTRVAMVVTEGGIIAPGESDIAPRNLIRATWVIVRRPDSRLFLLSHHASPVRG